MKVYKILGCVISLHIGIAVLLIQPGCQTVQPPSPTEAQERTARTPAAETPPTPSDPAPQPRERQGLDAAFNAGFETEQMESFEPIEPVEPLVPLSTRPTVTDTDPSYQTYTVKRGDSLWAIAQRYGVSVNELYAANNLTEDSVIRVGQQIQIPGAADSTATRTTTRTETTTPSASRGFEQATTTYTVQRGDSLSRIANRFDTTVNALKAANNKSSDLIRVGETLTVPDVGSDAGRAATPSAPAATRDTPSPSGTSQTHTVQAGEYPGQIARQYGMTANELLALNNISDPRRLRIGQELRVTGAASDATATSQPAPRTAPEPEPRAPVAPTQPTVPTQPSEIRIIEADPLIEGELDEPDLDDAFEDAFEIPVIRLED